MNHKNIQSILQDALEKEIPSSQIKLWSNIEENLVTRKNIQQGEKMNTVKSNRIGRVSFALVLIIALLTLAFITPQGRAFAQSILQFFTRAETNELSIEQTNETVIEAPRVLSVEEAETSAGFSAGFDVLVPESLPEGFTFQGASYTAEINTVIQQFGFVPEDIRLSIKQQPFTTIEACDLCGLVGASASVEAIQIGDVTGEYVEGVWELTDTGPVWRDDPYLKTLRWQKDGMAFELIFMGTELGKDDLVALAESMK